MTNNNQQTKRTGKQFLTGFLAALTVLLVAGGIARWIKDLGPVEPVGPGTTQSISDRTTGAEDPRSLDPSYKNGRFDGTSYRNDWLGFTFDMPADFEQMDTDAGAFSAASDEDCVMFFYNDMGGRTLTKEQCLEKTKRGYEEDGTVILDCSAHDGLMAGKSCIVLDFKMILDGTVVYQRGYHRFVDGQSAVLLLSSTSEYGIARMESHLI